MTFIYMRVPVRGKATQPLERNGRILSAHENQLFSPVLAASAHVPILSCGYLRSPEIVCYSMSFLFKADRLQMIVVAKKYICVATVHQ